MRAAKALTGLPEIAGTAMSEGELTFSKVRALTRLAHHVDAEAEAELVAIAREIPTAQVEKLIREWRYLDRDGERDLERRRHATRRFSIAPDGDGMYVVRGRLPAEAGAAEGRRARARRRALPGLPAR